MGSFGFAIGTGELLPIIKINGKEGKIERTTWDGQNRGIETVTDFAALFDFATLKTGWIEFGDKGPDKRLVAIGDPMPDRPGEKFKQGIQIIVFLPGGLGCHEICTTASGVLGALESIHDAAVAAPEWASGQVPVVRLKEFRKEGTGLKVRTIPSFEIIGWNARPKELEAHKATPKPRAALPSQQNQASAQAAPSTGSTPMPPPAAKPEMAASLDFG